MKVFYSCLLFLFTSILVAQNAVISGTILDDANGSTLPGVDVMIKSLNLTTSTGADGKYIFRNLTAGSYLVEFSYTGYDSKEVSDVIVKDNEITDLNITLNEIKKNQLKEVVITRTKAKAESVKSLLLLQKNNSSVSDGISAETIKRTPDKTTSDVLKRISGASIQDNRFVIIRGLNDRYNAAFLNGAPLPSSEPDRKAFSFDVFPSNMLDNLVITKTASPDLPGDFAGGVIQINTKAVPDKNFQSLTIGTGVNTITTFKTQKTYNGSSTDWLGFDNGTRSLPSVMPSTDAFNALTYQEKADLAKVFPSDWAIFEKKFRPNANFQYTVGHHFDFKEKVLGLLLSVSNSTTNNYNETTRADYDSPDITLPSNTVSKYFDKNYSEQVLTSALANISLKFNGNHSVSFKNMFSLNSTDLVVERSGKLEYNESQVINSNVRWYTSNKVYSGQLNGDHYFSNPKIKINWTGFYSKVSRSIPNLRRNIYTITDPNSSDPIDSTPVANIPNNNGGPDYGGGMFFSENKEDIYGGKFDISKKFDFNENFNNEIKIGAFYQLRSRDFFARQLQYNILTLGGNFNYSLLNLDDSSIFSPSNIGVISPGVNGFTLFEGTKTTDSYQGGSKLAASYIMLDNRINKLRFVWGVRVEDFNQTLNSRLTQSETLNLDTNKLDILPSVNIIYSINKNKNLRFSYSRTINRPEYRELAPFGFYDFTTQFFTQGNDKITRSSVQNFDLRYEIYPEKGQMFTVSYFLKKFKDPIEIIQQLNNKTVTYENASSAVNSGIELEFRVLLSSLFNDENAPFLDDITWFSNLAVIKSVVDVSSNSASVESERPMQGQSPYLFNSGIQYINKDNGLMVSANINKAGNRIAFGAGEEVPAIWEKGRTFLDLQIAKSFYKNKFELKLNVQNILAQDLIFYQNNYRNSVSYGTIESLGNYLFTGDYHYQDGFNAADDDIIWQTKYGRSFSLSATFNF
jgi:TonB-dependent receptor